MPGGRPAHIMQSVMQRSDVEASRVCGRSVALITNPFDVIKTRLMDQARAAPYRPAPYRPANC